MEGTSSGAYEHNPRWENNGEQRAQEVQPFATSPEDPTSYFPIASSGDGVEVRPAVSTTDTESFDTEAYARGLFSTEEELADPKFTTPIVCQSPTTARLYKESGLNEQPTLAEMKTHAVMNALLGPETAIEAIEMVIGRKVQHEKEQIPEYRTLILENTAGELTPERAWSLLVQAHDKYKEPPTS